jgi:hypothetical protein
VDKFCLNGIARALSLIAQNSKALINLQSSTVIWSRESAHASKPLELTQVKCMQW